MKTLLAVLISLLLVAPLQAQNKKDQLGAESTIDPVTITIVCRVNMKNTTNQWLANNLGATGDNLSVQLIGVNDPDNTPTTHNACSWSAFERAHSDQFRNGVVNSPNVHLFVHEGTQTYFWTDIASLGLRVKPQPFPF